MALNQFFDQFPRLIKGLKRRESTLKILNPKFLILFFLIIIFVLTFEISTSLIKKKNKKENQNFSSLVETREFSNFTNHLITKINNPYKEIKYVIQNNDSIEKILKKLDVNSNNIKDITVRLKKEKLTNIYAGRI